MIRSLLQTIRLRLLKQAFLNTLGEAWLVSLGLLVAGHAVFAAFSGPISTSTLVASLGAAFAGGFLIAAVVTWVRRPTTQQVATEMDSRMGAHERFSTALAFAEIPSPTPFHTLALKECEDYLRGVNIAKWVPWRFPKALGWVPVPLITLALLNLFATGSNLEELPAQRPPDKSTLELAQKLDTLANRIEKQQDPASEEFKRIAEALKKSAAQLRNEASTPSQDAARLRQLSGLENLLQATQQRSALEELADALSKSDAALSAAEALRKGDADRAADELAALAKNMADGTLSKAQQEELQKALREAAEKLGGKSPLGSAASKSASAMRQGSPEEAAKAIKELSQAIRNQQNSRHASQSTSGKTMQTLASQLQELKAGEAQNMGKDAGEADSQDGPAREQPFIGDFSQGKPAEKPGLGETPGQGTPASEKDHGTKATPYGNTKTPEAETSTSLLLQGMLGEGETLRMLIPGKAQTESAATNYRALYEATAPAAEDALNRENIPLGSRLFIKRYFEAIRPER